MHEPAASETLTKTRGADDGVAVAVVPVLRGVHVRRGASFRRSNHDRRRTSSSNSPVTAAPGLDVGLLYYGLVLYQMLAWLVVLLTIAAVVAVALATVGPYTCRYANARSQVWLQAMVSQQLVGAPVQRLGGRAEGGAGMQRHRSLSNVIFGACGAA